MKAKRVLAKPDDQQQEKPETVGIYSPYGELIDLHIHVGGAVAPHVLWSIAHQQGLKLPFKNYWEFWDAVTVSKKTVKSLDDYWISFISGRKKSNPHPKPLNIRFIQSLARNIAPAL